MKLRDDFHALIDKISDENALKAYFQLIQSLSNNKGGEFWKELSPEQQTEILLSWEDSFEDNKLVASQKLRTQYS